MDSKLTGRVWTWIVSISLLTIIMTIWYCNDSQSVVVLLPSGKAAFYRGSWFHRDKFDLSRYGRKWQIFRSHPIESGELMVPFECPYNKYHLSRLEDGGKVYLIDKKAMTREELRVVNGEWSYDASDHWQSIFDLE